MVTPSQIKVCELILQWAPMTAFFWISTKGRDSCLLAYAAAVKIDQLRMGDADIGAQANTIGYRHLKTPLAIIHSLLQHYKPPGRLHH